MHRPTGRELWTVLRMSALLGPHSWHSLFNCHLSALLLLHLDHLPIRSSGSYPALRFPYSWQLISDPSDWLWKEANQQKHFSSKTFSSVWLLLYQYRSYLHVHLIFSFSGLLNPLEHKRGHLSALRSTFYSSRRPRFSSKLPQGSE